MTRLERGAQAMSDIDVELPDFPTAEPFVILRMTKHFTNDKWAASLSNKEIDDLIVMLEYHRREANDAFAQKQAGEDPD